MNVCTVKNKTFTHDHALNSTKCLICLHRILASLQDVIPLQGNSTIKPIYVLLLLRNKYIERHLQFANSKTRYVK